MTRQTHINKIAYSSINNVAFIVEDYTSDYDSITKSK